MAHAKFPIFFLIFLFLFSSFDTRIVEATNHIDAQPPVAAVSAKIMDIHEKMADRLHFLHKVGVSMKSRKLLESEVVQLDYDYAGPNPKHDPRKGRGGGRSL